MSVALMTDDPQDRDFEAYVRFRTDFGSWGELVTAALNDYLARAYG